MKVGLIINPIAGMGGAVGLKGTDGDETVARARALGAQPLSSQRTKRALSVLASSPTGAIPDWIAPEGEMGGDALAAFGWPVETIAVAQPPSDRATRHAVRRMRDEAANLIVFAGGDGTARDIVAEIGLEIPILGIPCGVKMHSGVFGLTPEATGRLLAEIIGGRARIGYRRAEVMDIDEAALRNGHLNARLYGYARVPHLQNLVQNAKATPLSDEALLEALGREVAGEMRPGTTYLIGPGTTAKRPLATLGIEGALLGLDVVRDRRLLASDTTADDAMALAGDGPLAIIAGVTGGQGFVFGRGNQQIGPEAIARCWPHNVVILASGEKLARLPRPELVVDTGDPALDVRLRGHAAIRYAPRRSMMMRLV